MSRKPVLTFYTNMPTPYQLDFFGALKEHFDLRVVYFTTREADRQWQLGTSGEGYAVKVLKNSRLALMIQKKVPSFHYSREIISLAKEDDGEFVLVNGTYWSPNVVLALFYSYKKNKKIAFWSEPVFPVNNRLRFWLKKAMLWPVRRYTNFLLAIGKQAESAYRKYGYNKSIYNIPYNINSRLFRKEELQQRIFQKLLNEYKSKGETVLLSSGSLIPRKGMDTVISAFLRLPSQVNARLIIMGDGEVKEDLKRLSNNNERIHFIGFQEKEMIPYWFNLADIFVFASRYDGWGLVINEATAAGNAIICSNVVGAAADKLIDMHNAIILDPEDVTGFANAMESLITNNELRSELLRNSESLKAVFSSDYNAQRVYDIYSNA